MNASCPHCGKVLKVKDAWSGKTLKCPGCSKTFKVGGDGGAVSGAAGGGVSRRVGPQPSAPRPAGPPQRVKTVEPRAGRFAFNWGVLAIIGGLSLIPIAIAVFLIGPRRAMKHWDAHRVQADDDVRTLVEHAIRAEASHAGTWNPNVAIGGTPRVEDLNFHPEMMVLSMPETVHFAGITNGGKFDGDYTYATREIRGNLTIGGITLGGVHIDAEGVTMPGGQTEKSPIGLPKRGAANVSHALTGRLINGVPQIELDGKRLDIYYPPKRTDDEG